MICPVCHKEMTEEDFGGVMVDICKSGCKGIWFDWCELVKLDEKNEGLGKALKEAIEYPRTNNEDRQQINCPKCDIPMHIHKYQSAKEINVAECYACGGFFLDSGELRNVRDNFMGEEEEREYCQKLLDDMPGFKEAQADSEKRKSRSDALMNLTRYVRLSYYMAGR